MYSKKPGYPEACFGRLTDNRVFFIANYRYEDSG